jgi:hypothetical protein
MGSVKEWADRHKISPVAAYKRIRSVNIPVVKGRLDLDQADEIWSRNLNPSKQLGGAAAAEAHRENAPAPIESNIRGRLQIQREALRIKREQLTIDQMEGKLVNLAEVRAFEARAFAAIRTSLLAIPGEIRDDLARLEDPVEIEAILRGRINKALRELAEWRPSGDRETREERIEEAVV